MNNRKTLLRVCALGLVVLMLGGCSALISDPVVATVGDVEVTYSQFYNVFETYSAYGMLDTSTAEGLEEAHQTVFDVLIDGTLPLAIAHEQGLTLTEEEEAEALENAAADMESYLSTYLDDSITDEDARMEAAIEAFNDAYASAGVTYEQAKEETEQSYLDQALGNKLIDQIRSEVPATTDEEAQTWYDEQLAAEREEYAEDSTAYYYDSQYYSYTGEVQPLVAPEGLFYVKHILIRDDSDDSDTSSDSSGEESLSSSDSVSFTDPEELANTVLEKVEAGEDFDTLIEAYGDDPGMESEPTKSQGYIIGEGFDSIYDDAFYEAAMELKETGDTSGIVKGSSGYHIIRRVGDVSTDPIPFEDVVEEIKTYLDTQKQDEAYNAKLEEWREQVEIKTYEKRVSYIGLQ